VDGLEGLEDRARSGRPRTVTAEVETEVVRRTLEEKPPGGYPLEQQPPGRGRGAAPQPDLRRHHQV